MTSEDVLFVGKGNGALSWIRTGAPAFYLGCDWAGIVGTPPHLGLEASLSRKGIEVPRFEDYKIVILQQPAGREWMNEILKLRQRGIIVLYEVDDYLHAVRKMPGHQAKDVYSKKRLKDYEMCMKAANGLICSTQWLAKKYRKFNKNTYVCENTIELNRYKDLKLPERKTVNILWAGGNGHRDTAGKWLPAVEQILKEYPQTRFISVGLSIAHRLNNPQQAASLPFVSIENYPAVLTNADISLGPCGKNDFFRAKSQIRFYEAGALGIPFIGDPFVYDEIQDSVTGLNAESSADAYQAIKYLIDRPEERDRIGRNAKWYIEDNRNISTGIEQWENVFLSEING